MGEFPSNGILASRAVTGSLVSVTKRLAPLKPQASHAALFSPWGAS